MESASTTPPCARDPAHHAALVRQPASCFRFSTFARAAKREWQLLVLIDVAIDAALGGPAELRSRAVTAQPKGFIEGCVCCERTLNVVRTGGSQVHESPPSMFAGESGTGRVGGLSARRLPSQLTRRCSTLDPMLSDRNWRLYAAAAWIELRTGGFPRLCPYHL